MTPEERDLLRETAALTKENNKILRGIRRSNRWSAFFRTIYWVVIIGSALGAYYYIQPYINVMIDSYNGMKDNLDTVKDVTTSLPSWLGGKQ